MKNFISKSRNKQCNYIRLTSSIYTAKIFNILLFLLFLINNCLAQGALTNLDKLNGLNGFKFNTSPTNYTNLKIDESKSDRKKSKLTYNINDSTKRKYRNYYAELGELEFYSNKLYEILLWFRFNEIYIKLSNDVFHKTPLQEIYEHTTAVFGKETNYEEEMGIIGVGRIWKWENSKYIFKIYEVTEKDDWKDGVKISNLDVQNIFIYFIYKPVQNEVFLLDY